MRSFSISCLKPQKPSALAERFEQILSEKVDQSTKSLIDQDPKLKDVFAKYYYNENEEQSFEDTQLQEKARLRAFEQKYQREIGFSKSQYLLKTKEDKQMSNPWTGTENTRDTALRMLIDSAPKPKKIKRGKTLFTPPKAFGARVTDAKEGSLDYKLAKTVSPADREKDEFKEMYKERLLGPAMFVDHSSSSNALGMIANMASARINASINRKTGHFDSPNMDKVRGKPLEKDRLAHSTDSNYFMNQILKNQDCLPVWIENQQGIDREISTFRVDLQRKLVRAIVDSVTEKVGSSKHEIMHYIASQDGEVLKEAAHTRLLKREARYIEAKIADLNRGIRSYNLQCPSPGLHKWKLTQTNELKMSLDQIFGNLETFVDEHVTLLEPRTTTKMSSGHSLLGLFDSKSSGASASSESTQTNLPETSGLEFWKSLRSVFKS